MEYCQKKEKRVIVNEQHDRKQHRKKNTEKKIRELTGEKWKT